MQFDRETRSDANLVRAYATGVVRVNERLIAGSVVIDAQHIVTDWPPRRLDQLDADHLQTVLALEPEIIILGTGATTCFPAPQILAGIMGRGIGIEAMDNAAACRTYNILVHERRRVALALLVDEATG